MEFTPEMDQRIVELYTKPYVRGLISAQARTWNCKVSQVTRRAEQKGLTPHTRRKNTRRWTTPEIHLLRSLPHLTHKEISHAFLNAGYHRTPDSIENFRFRDGWKTYVERDELIVGYSAQSLAKIMGVDFSTVRRWIRLKYLKARSEEGNIRIAAYRIQPKHVQDFLKNYIHYIDLSKVDKYWFVDILTLKS